MSPLNGAARPMVRLSRNVVHENPWLHVSEDRVLNSGGELSTYGLLHKPDFSLTVPTNTDGTAVCLIRQYRYPVEEWRVEFPQGSCPQEAGSALIPPATALAELREEAGILARDLTPLGMIHESYGITGCRCHVFRATVHSVGVQETEPSEHISPPFWLSHEEFWEHVDRGEVSDAPSMAAMALYERSRRGH